MLTRSFWLPDNPLTSLTANKNLGLTRAMKAFFQVSTFLVRFNITPGDYSAGWFLFFIYPWEIFFYHLSNSNTASFQTNFHCNANVAHHLIQHSFIIWLTWCWWQSSGWYSRRLFLLKMVSKMFVVVNFFIGLKKKVTANLCTAMMENKKTFKKIKLSDALLRFRSYEWECSKSV